MNIVANFGKQLETAEVARLNSLANASIDKENNKKKFHISAKE